MDATEVSPAAAAWLTRWVTHPEARALILDVDLPARAGRVWTAFTTSYGLRAWWWAQWDDVSVEVDARPGGSFRFSADAAGVAVHGVYSVADRAAGRLAFTWVTMDAAEATRGETVEIALSAAPSGSHLTLRHRAPWADDVTIELRREEWTAALEQLSAALARASRPRGRGVLFGERAATEH